MKKPYVASKTQIKGILRLLSFDPRNDPVHGQALQASLSPDYHRDRAIVLIRDLNNAENQTVAGRAKSLKLIFVHLIWWHLRTPCSSMDDPKNVELNVSAS